MNHIFQRVEADLVVSITDLKKNPNAVLTAAEQQAVAILNHNRVVGYVISPVAWEGMLEALDDLRLMEIADKRRKEPTIEVSLDELSGPIHRKRGQKLEQTGIDGTGAIRESAASARRKSTRSSG